MPSFAALAGAPTPFDPTAGFATSWLLPTPVLAAVRLLFSLYAFVATFVIYGLSSPADDRQSFSYFTVLTYWALAFYFAFAGAHSVSAARSSVKGTYDLQRWPRPLQALHSLYYTTVVVFPFIVTVVYWGLLYKAPFFPVVFDAWSNITRHGLNSFFALFEVLIPRTAPPPPLHLLFLVILLALYLGLAYLTRRTQGFYVYSFLDVEQQGAGKTAGYIVGILVGACIVFGIVWAVIWARRRLTEGRRTRTKFGDVEMSGMDGAYHR